MDTLLEFDNTLIQDDEPTAVGVGLYPEDTFNQDSHEPGITITHMEAMPDQSDRDKIISLPKKLLEKGRNSKLPVVLM